MFNIANVLITASSVLTVSVPWQGTVFISKSHFVNLPVWSSKLKKQTLPSSLQVAKYLSSGKKLASRGLGNPESMISNKEISPLFSTLYIVLLFY